MKNQIAILVLIAGLWSCNQKSAEPVESIATEPSPIEFADASYVELCKQGLANMTSGDIDGFLSSYADNAVYRWNNGDSIAGKEAIVAYWKDRRGNAIDKIEFSNDIWLSLKVNSSDQGVRTGNWVLSWYYTTATYKATGKSMSQYIHTIYHFDANGKVDEVIQYLDRAPIMAAMTK